jgi:hypothetical protein
MQTNFLHGLMKTKNGSLLFLLAVCLCGCTSYALRRSTANQAKTVSDFMQDQVLYNLALYKDYYDNHRANGLPSFVKLINGQATVQQTINGQLALKIPATGGVEKDPQINGSHQSSDNWSFVPVVDPNELNRLFTVYRTQFEFVSPAEMKQVFPTPAPPLDQWGRPTLKYTPDTNPDGTVKLINNQPVFIVTTNKMEKHEPPIIPGAKDKDGTVKDGWFSFTEPSKNIKAFKAGPYLNKYVWITDRQGFFKFTLLTLGGTNNLTAKPATGVFLLNNNGLIMAPQ